MKNYRKDNMLRRFKKKESVLDEPITEILDKMKHYGPDNEEYPHLVDNLERLNKLKQKERRFKFSPDTMLIVGGNLLGILIIVAYEQKHVIVSKGLTFVGRSKQLP
jgi:hypothetical protein